MASSRTEIEGHLVPILPLGTRVLVRPKITPDYVGNGKIFIPDNCKPKCPTTGIVEALGDELFDEKGECRLQPGMEVLYSQYAGLEVKFRDGDEKGNLYQLLEYSDIQGILQDNMSLVQEKNQGEWIPSK